MAPLVNGTSQNRSIRDFFAAAPTSKVKIHHQRNDTSSDGDEIVVATRTTTPAKPDTSNRKTHKQINPQPSNVKSRSQNTPARRINEESRTRDGSPSLSSRTSSTAVRTRKRSRNAGQPTTQLKNSDGHSRSPVQSPVKLPLHSPQSTPFRSQIETSNYSAPTRNGVCLDTIAQPDVLEESRESDRRQSFGKRVLTAVRIPSLPSDGNEIDIDLNLESSPSTELGSTEPEAAPPSSALETTLSFVGTQSSSRRIVRNGLQAVTNSDSEVSGDSSDEGLMDVSVFIPHKRRRPSQAEEDLNLCRGSRTQKPARQSSRLADLEAERARRSSPIAPPSQTLYRHSLADMVAQMQKSKQVEARILSLENEIVEAKTTDQKGDPDSLNDGNHPRALAAAESDSDEREAVLQALSRMEGLKGGEGYHFFLDGTPLFDNTPFPATSLPTGEWYHLMADDRLRTQACISGFVTDMVAHHPLPMEVTLWMARQLAHERNDVLCEAYVDILQASLQHETSISDTMGRLSCYYKTRSFSESLWTGGHSPGLPPGITYLVRIISSVAPSSDARITDAPPSDTSAAVLDFASVLIDEHVQQDASLSMTIMTSIEETLEALSEESFEMLMSEVSETLFETEEMSPRNRCSFIASFPAGTSRAYKLRRSLALACFTTAPGQPKPTDQTDWAKTIVAALQTRPELVISESADYDLLGALVDILDIAIGSGFADLSSDLTALSSDPVERVSAAEALHNKQTDALTIHLQAMASRIRDGGATHLDRTEAKSVIERVVARLEHSVRTRAKPIKDIFGSRSTTQTGLKGFYARANKLEHVVKG